MPVENSSGKQGQEVWGKMQPYQEQYIRNAQEISRLSDFYPEGADDSFERWFEQRKQAEQDNFFLCSCKKSAFFFSKTAKECI